MKITLFILILIIILFVYLKIKSKSYFFKQSEQFLRDARIDLISSLRLKGRTDNDINEYLKAYDFFCKEENKNKYDGSTFVRDLYLLKCPVLNVVLSPDAMLHDYDYIIGANKSVSKQIKTSIKYIKNLIANGHAFHWERLLGLIIISPFFAIYNNIKNKINP